MNTKSLKVAASRFERRKERTRHDLRDGITIDFVPMRKELA